MGWRVLHLGTKRTNQCSRSRSGGLDGGGCSSSEQGRDRVVREARPVGPRDGRAD